MTIKLIIPSLDSQGRFVDPAIPINPADPSNNAGYVAAMINNIVAPSTVTASITGAGQTLTGAQICNGYVFRTLAGADTDTTPTVAQVVAQLRAQVPRLQPLHLNGASFIFTLINAAAFVLTTTIDASWTTTGTPLPVVNIAASSWKEYALTFVVTGNNTAPVYTGSTWFAVRAGPVQ